MFFYGKRYLVFEIPSCETPSTSFMLPYLFHVTISFLMFIYLKKCHDASGSYDVLDEDESPDPVTVVLFDDNFDVAWHSSAGERDGSFALSGLKGRYQLCIGNGHGGYMDDDVYKKKHPDHHLDDDEFDYDNDDGSDRTIGFTIRVSPEKGTYAHQRLLQKTKVDGEAADSVNPMEEHSEQLVDLATSLADKMEVLQDHQLYIKSREALHRDIVENTFSLVMKWTLLESAILVLISLTQVFYLKRFFEKKRYL